MVRWAHSRPFAAPQHKPDVESKHLHTTKLATEQHSFFFPNRCAYDGTDSASNCIAITGAFSTSISTSVETTKFASNTLSHFAAKSAALAESKPSPDLSANLSPEPAAHSSTNAAAHSPTVEFSDTRANASTDKHFCTILGNAKANVAT